MAETEDGEIVDSDEEMGKSNNISTNSGLSKFGAYGGVVQSSGAASVNEYRTASRQTYSSSEDDYSDEEDSFLWKRKKIRFQATKDQPFVNPLLQKKKDMPNSESDVSDTCMSPVKSFPAKAQTSENFWTQPAKAPAQASMQTKPRRKYNNIWGSVMTEQTLSSTLGGFDVNLPLKEKVDYAVEDRSVENYDFTLKDKDTRPDPVEYEEDMGDKESEHDELTQDICDKETFGKEEEQKQADRLKRKRKVKDRLGPRPSDIKNDQNRVSAKGRLGTRNVKERLGEKVPVIVEKPEGYIDVTEEDSVEKVVNALVENLHEPKVQLMANVVDVLGKKRAIELMHDTEMIDAQGGMMTNDNARKRTPGGVFLQLLKFSCDLSSEQQKEIFGDERAAYNKDRKKRAAVYQKRKKEERKRRLGELNFLDSIKEYQTVKEEVKEEETINKILNNEEVTIDKKINKDLEMEGSIDDELGEEPDIEIGE